MSILGGLFKKRTLPELMADADALFDKAAFGEAKLAYDRVEERAKKESPELAARAHARAEECCDRIADARIAEAMRLRSAGQIDLAREELQHALQTAQSDASTQRVRDAQRELEQSDAHEHAVEAPPLSDEERLTLLTSAWEPLQAEELEAYGEPLAQALLALEDERAGIALETLLSLAESNPNGSYIWLEIARAQLAVSELAASEAALRKFLSRIGPEEGGTARLLAHRELARLCHERGDREGAVRELEASAEALEDDPRPLLDLGNYLRLIGRAAEAIEVLEMCAGLFEESAVEWPITMELGLACADAGEDERAIAALESVVQTLVMRGELDLPPQVAVPLAKLHEGRGNLARAADLYGGLAKGSDGENHALYHREAGRLLEALGLDDEARRMRERAEGLK